MTLTVKVVCICFIRTNKRSYAENVWCSTNYNILCFFKRRVCLVKVLPTISNVWKKMKAAETSSHGRLSASHNALPGHQRETKMANVLGENEPFVIFWRRHKPRRFSRHTFLLNTFRCRRRGRTAGHLYPVIFVVFVICRSGGDRMRYCCHRVFLLRGGGGGRGPTVSDLAGVTVLHAGYSC